MKRDKYKKKFAEQYKQSIRELDVKIDLPFTITTKSCPSSGMRQKWYLPLEIVLIGQKDDKQEPQETKSSLIVGGSSDVEYVFVAKKKGTFCLLGENRQQWRIATEPALPDRYVVHVRE